MLKSTEQAGIRILSTTGEHALRALLFLARQDGECVSAGAIARAVGAPANYLSKTLQVLARDGVVAGTRGPTGGFRLMQPAATVTVAQIASLFSEPIRSPMCLLGGIPCSHENACVAHAAWRQMHMQMSRMLDDVTLASLASGDVSLHPITTTTGEWS